MEKKDNVKENSKTNKLKISMIDGSEEYMSEFHREILEDELAALPPMNEGEVNLALIYFYENEDKYDAKVFIRNNTGRNINFNIIPLAIVDNEGTKVAEQVFDLKYIGDIPSYSARPVELEYDKDNVFSREALEKELKIIFVSQLKTSKSVQISFPDTPVNIPNSFSIEYKEFCNKLKALQENQISLSCFKILKNENSDIRVIIIGRNSYDKDIILNTMPLALVDADGNMISSGVFELSDDQGIISAKHAKIFEFIIPKEEVSLENVDVDTCKIVFRQ